MSGEPAADNPFWRFSLALYDRPDIAAACLRLQDCDGLDVNVILYCCWAASQGAALDEAALAPLVEKAAAWQSAVTGPLRAVRRSLKGGVAPVAAADSGALRDAVKELELESERLLQQVLWQAVTFPPPTGKEDVPTLALGNLERYAGLTGNADAADDLRRIAEAVSAVSAA